MMPGYGPGPSGQAAKVGIWPHLVVTMTSFSYMARVSGSGKDWGAEPRAIAVRCHAVSPGSGGRGEIEIGGVDSRAAGVNVAMMRTAGLALLLLFACVPPALAQTTNSTATSTTGGVDSATLRNGYPAGGGVVSLPTVQNSSASTTGTSTTTGTTATGTTAAEATATTTTGTTSATGGAGSATSSGSGVGGSTSGTGGAGGGRGGRAATTGSATSSRSSGTQSG